MRTRPDTLAEFSRWLKDGSTTMRLGSAGFLDNFYMAGHAERQLMIDDTPVATENGHDDVVLGAMGEHLARRWGLRIPAWTNEAHRFGTTPWFGTRLRDLHPLLMAQSPLAFRRRMLFVDREPLSRARMPLDEAATSGASPRPM